MVRVRPERFPPGIVKKLHVQWSCMYKVLNELVQTPELDLPRDLAISPVFNVEDFDVLPRALSYIVIWMTPALTLSHAYRYHHLPPIPLWRGTATIPKIEVILDDKIVSTIEDEFQ